MPLIKSASQAAFQSNLKAELSAGKKKDQALAIAFDVKRRSRASGGAAPTPWQVRAEARSMMHTGPIMSAVGGRTDHHKISVPGAAYVLPADHVSALGQGNSQNGMAILGKMFSGGPYGSSAAPMRSGKHKFADGGSVGEPVPIMAAGGEFVVSPSDVARVGGGDVDKGHKILDSWVVQTRKQHIKTLRKLPGPARD